jgi:hypothetical protein
MESIEMGLYTVGVFQDVGSAGQGLSALVSHNFTIEELSLMAVESPEVNALVEETFGDSGETLDVKNVGVVRTFGNLKTALQQGSEHDCGSEGLAATMRKVGFQTHDGFIFETLIGRGGVLIAIQSESRAADALSVLHSYGGGNASIGAWAGRV